MQVGNVQGMANNTENSVDSKKPEDCAAATPAVRLPTAKPHDVLGMRGPDTWKLGMELGYTKFGPRVFEWRVPPLV